MKKILLALILLLPIGGAVYFFLWNKPHKDVNKEPLIDITAPQLFSEFTANEQIANKKYLNKAIRVSGIIASADKNQDKQAYIVLQTDDALNGVMCTLKDSTFMARTGIPVIVKGFCSGFVGDVKLTDCVIATDAP